MKIRSCFEIALFELRHSFKIFLFYSVICISLMSVSASLLKAAMTIPDKISGIAHSLNADSIIVYDYSIDTIENILDNVNIISCSSGMVGDATELFGEENADNILLRDLRRGIIIDSDKFTNESREYIANNLLSGEFSPEKDNNPVWINDIMAKRLNLKCGDILKGSANLENPVELVVQGIFRKSDEVEYYYVKEKTNELIIGSFPDIKNEFWMRCDLFSDLNKIQKILKKNNMEYSCEDMMYRSLNMMYASFYSSCIILIVALSGIMTYLLEQYYSKRKSFFKMNSLLGMTEKNIIWVLFLLIEAVLVFSVICSGFLSSGIINRIDAYICELFSYDFELRGFPFIQMILIFSLVQISMAAIFRRLRKTIHISANKSIGRP